MTTALVVITDGRFEYLQRTVFSIFANLRGIDGPLIMVDDSGDEDFADECYTLWPMFDFVIHGERKGLGAAVTSGWDAAIRHGSDYIWHHEDDFVVQRPLDIAIWRHALSMTPFLSQLVAKRDAYSPEEHAAGGMIEAAPEKFRQVVAPFPYVRFDHLFSFNPCLYKVNTVQWLRWCSPEVSEDALGMTLRQGAYFSGIAGNLYDLPLVQHIGIERSPGWKA